MCSLAEKAWPCCGSAGNLAACLKSGIFVAVLDSFAFLPYPIEGASGPDGKKREVKRG